MNRGFVRATYWIGAIVDGLAAVQLLTPAGTRILGFEGLRTPGAAGQPAIIAAVLMLGFSAILVWAQRSPRLRRGVLAVTLLVIVGLTSANVASGVSGQIPWSALAPTLAIQAVLLAVFSASAWMMRGRTLDRLTRRRTESSCDAEDGR